MRRALNRETNLRGYSSRRDASRREGMGNGGHQLEHPLGCQPPFTYESCLPSLFFSWKIQHRKHPLSFMVMEFAHAEQNCCIYESVTDRLCIFHDCTMVPTSANDSLFFCFFLLFFSSSFFSPLSCQCRSCMSFSIPFFSPSSPHRVWRTISICLTRLTGTERNRIQRIRKREWKGGESFFFVCVCRSL